MIQYARTHQCRRQMILDYFGDPAQVTDCGCDVCGKGDLNAKSPEAPVVMADEVVTIVRQILSAIARCNGKFGVGAVADMLAGLSNERTRKMGPRSALDFRPPENLSRQANYRDDPSHFGNGPCPPERSRRREIPPRRRNNRAGISVMRGEEAPQFPRRSAPATRQTGDAQARADAPPQTESRNPGYEYNDALDPELQTPLRNPPPAPRPTRPRNAAFPPTSSATIPPSSSSRIPPSRGRPRRRSREWDQYKIKMYGQAFLDA